MQFPGHTFGFKPVNYRVLETFQICNVPFMHFHVFALHAKPPGRLWLTNTLKIRQQSSVTDNAEFIPSLRLAKECHVGILLRSQMTASLTGSLLYVRLCDSLKEREVKRFSFHLCIISSVHLSTHPIGLLSFCSYLC